MGYRRLFIVRKDLHMSPGKLAAQIAHCTEAYYTRLIRDNMVGQVVSGPENIGMYLIDQIHIDQNIYEQYLDGRFVKTICQARNKSQLLKAKALAENEGLIENVDFGFIYDACLTELTPEEDNGTCLTCFWTVPISDETAHAISRKYHLYTE